MSVAWQPSATLDNLRLRAEIIQQIRAFFYQRNYLEVETPIMARHGVTDAYLANMKAIFRHQTYCLQTSPEYHMKRLLAAGSGAIFQIARVFRDDELGRWHNPEFTLLEWYQPGFDHHDLMNEVDALLQEILGCAKARRVTYRQVFLDTCQLDPFEASIEQLRHCLQRYELDYVIPVDEQDVDQYLFLLMSHIIEPSLATESNPVAVYGFPASQAALAQINEHKEADRFEFYFRGVELANGFHELIDAKAQEQRFEEDLQLRQKLQIELPSMDPFLLAALEHGIAPCSGVALGVDRLLALAMQQDSIASVMAFDFSRA